MWGKKPQYKSLVSLLFQFNFFNTSYDSDDADSSPLMCVTFMKHNEIVTANLRGQFKIWDLRLKDNEPMSIFMSSDECGPATCVAHHPTQRHILTAGGHEGPLTIFDLRKSTHPVSVLKAHKGPISEIVFHTERPDNFFTCSWSGELWQWNSKSQGVQGIIIINYLFCIFYFFLRCGRTLASKRKPEA